MAMAPKGPKKKYDYFDGGRGISDLQIHEDSQDHSDSSNSPKNCSYNVSPSESSSMIYSPFPEQEHERDPDPDLDSPIDYSATSRIISPIAYQPRPPFSPVPYQDFTPHHPVLSGAFQQDFGEPSATYRELQERYGSDFARPNWNIPETRDCFSNSSLENYSNGVRESFNHGGPPTYVLEDEDEDPRRCHSRSQNSKNKRPQKCRMCANHGKTVDMKGHKWYCPHRDCDCPECDITRKTQFYMKERQKLTRHQQQQSDDRFLSPSGFPEPHRRRVLDNAQMDFPRVDEMVNQTQNILDYDLFNKVNEACRPKSSNPFQ